MAVGFSAKTKHRMGKRRPDSDSASNSTWKWCISSSIGEKKFSLTPPPLDSLLRFWLPVDGFCRAIARLKAKSATHSLKQTACSYLSSFRCETPFKILGHWWKTTELEFGTFWDVASKRSIGLENGFQIWNQREILYQHGEFQVNRREKFSLTSPPSGELASILASSGRILSCNRSFES